MTNSRTTAAPDLPAGTTLKLSSTAWAYGRGCEPGHPVVITVTTVRHDLARYFDNQQVWVDGHAAECRADHPPCLQLLVWTTALDAAAAEAGCRARVSGHP